MYIFKIEQYDILKKYDFVNRNLIIIPTFDFYLNEGRHEGSKGGTFITMMGQIITQDVFFPAKTPIIAMLRPNGFLYQGVRNTENKNLLWLGF